MTNANPTVKDILQMAMQGTLVLPDFQRGFIWEPEKVRELIVSVLGAYFIGSMLILESSKDNPLFRLKLIEGVEKVNKGAQIQSQIKILLDGQQRVTALFYAMHEPEITLKGRKNPSKIFIDLERALQQDWDSAVRILSAKDKKTLAEIEGKTLTIPARLLMDVGELAVKFIRDARFKDIINIANEFLNYPLHFVTLPSNTTPEKIIETFERVNSTGEPLSVFDLIVARLYKHDIKLRDLWNQAKGRYGFAKSVSAENVLRVVTLLRDKGTKRKALLELEHKGFLEDWEEACHAMEKAYTRIVDSKHGYGAFIFDKWAPYSTMIVPLAAIIGNMYRTKTIIKSNWDKIDRWYWVSVFDGRYDEGAISKQESDYKDLIDWMKDDTKTPDYIERFEPMKVDLSVERQSSAIYRGVIALCVLKGALDFKSGQPPKLFEKYIEDDHIFPESLFHENQIWNRTILATNERKWKKKPSVYFKEKENCIAKRN